MMVDNKNLYGSDPEREPVHTESFVVHIISGNSNPSEFNGCGQDINPTRIDSRCEFTLNGAIVHGVPVAIVAGKYNVIELMPLPSINDVNGRPVTCQASFSSDCNSTIQDFQVKTCTITNTAIEQ